MIDNGPDLTELYRKYRPRRLKDILGQPDAVRILAEKLKQNKVPHAILFSGPSGTGKTTLAYVLAVKLGCGKADFEEINAADSRGIDTIREINQKKMLNPIEGSCRVIVLDEIHQGTKDAQTALLKTLEQCPSHLYFILCTTDPRKLLDTIKNRCELKIYLKPLSNTDIETLVKQVAILEDTTVSDQLAAKIAENAEGSARTALSLLSQALAFTTEEQRLKAVIRTDVAKKAWDLVQLLIPFNGQRPTWSTVSEILKSMEGEEPEMVRRMVMATARTHLLKGGNLAEYGYNVINVFDCSYPLNDGKSGHAVLAARCWEVCKKQR